MLQNLRRSVPLVLLGGLLLGGGVLLGVGIGRYHTRPFPFQLPERSLNASTASTGDNFAVATGLIDTEAEGVFVLDFLTGELQCAVLNHRTTKFSALFKTNVTKDLGMSKNAKYLMVTGQVNFPRGVGVTRPALSVVYVVDTGSGNMVAYGIPWQRELASSGRAQIGTLVPIDGLKVRTVSIREQ